MTFVLTTGGHNAGIIAEPGRPRRAFRLLRDGAKDPPLDPDAWTPLHRRRQAPGGRLGSAGWRITRAAR